MDNLAFYEVNFIIFLGVLCYVRARKDLAAPILSTPFYILWRIDPVAKRWLCKHRPMLGKARNNSTWLCNPFLSNGWVTTPLQQLLLKMAFSTRSVQNGYKEVNWGNQFSWELKVRLWSEELVARVGLWKDDLMCCSCSETVIITVLNSVDRTRLTKRLGLS
jgi:hypothetical protein